MEPTGKRGGARPGAGRKPMHFGALGKSILLTKEQWDYAKSIGDGNASEGIRRLISRDGGLKRVGTNGGKRPHRKGKRGEAEFTRLIESMGWNVIQLSDGLDIEDVIARDASGTTYSIEVKNTSTITEVHKIQAVAQAKKRGFPWMLASKISGTSCWLVQSKNKRPVIFGPDSGETENE